MNDDCTLNRRSERLRTALKHKSNHHRQQKAMITTKRRNIHLPMEIIEELFIRMPLKSITKFKCVCKEWNNFISGHQFRSLYQSQHRHRQACRSGYFYYSNISLSLSTNDKYISKSAPAKVVNICNIGKKDLALCHDMQKLGYVVGTSNGLLLLSKNNTSYYVYDLLTKKTAKLPEPHTKYSYASAGLICKEGEPDCLTNIINTSSYHYKIVRVEVKSKKTTTCELETYSSETRIWQKSLMTATSKFCLCMLCMPKVIRGVMHWKNDDGNITAYNPEDPSGRAISIEVPNLNNCVRAKITGYGDGLVIFIRNSSNDIDMWFLGRSYLDEDVVDRSRWTFFRKVCFAELGQSLGDSLPTGPIRRLFAIDFHPRDSNVIFLQMNNTFISYNLNEKRVDFIRSFGEGDRFFNPYSYFFFEWPLWPRL